MTIAILSFSFVLLVLVGMPISFAMGISSLLAMLYQSDLPINLLVHRTVMGIDSFVLLAIPLFIFAGSIMEQGGISERLVRFAYTLLGRFRGGLPMVVVGSTMLQSGISGSTVADVSAMSAMTLKPLENEGYPRPYSLSVIGASCAFSILIPPCILMVVVAAVANTSVVAVFAAGVVPAVVIGLMFFAFIHIQARLQNMPRGDDVLQHVHVLEVGDHRHVGVDDDGVDAVVLREDAHDIRRRPALVLLQGAGRHVHRIEHRR
ncbi:TRAP transporter large permease subunit, partial [Bordetella bronchiseptica]|uniref:TRAP transporter large permease subunit n=1 Tax=Bordetella bronchiseptica TaxID=518 RepID=UPI0004A0E964